MARQTTGRPVERDGGRGDARDARDLAVPQQLGEAQRGERGPPLHDVEVVRERRPPSGGRSARDRRSASTRRPAAARTAVASVRAASETTGSRSTACANGCRLARRHAAEAVGGRGALLDLGARDVEHEPQERAIDAISPSLASSPQLLARSSDDDAARGSPTARTPHHVSLAFTAQHRRQIDEELEREALARRQEIVVGEREHD